MTTQTKRVKVSPFIKRSLDELKTEEDWSYGLVIEALIDEHNELPQRIQDMENKLKYDYVETSVYDNAFMESINAKAEVKKLTDKLKETTKSLTEKMQNKENQSIAKLNECQKDYQEDYDKLQDTLVFASNKEDTLISKNEDLEHNIGELNSVLSVLQEKYDKSVSQYNGLRDFVDNECLITKNQMKTLYHISAYLSGVINRNRCFTVNQIVDKLGSHPSILFVKEDIEDVIPLFSYKIFPIKTYKEKDGTVCYRFDKHYLTR